MNQKVLGWGLGIAVLLGFGWLAYIIHGNTKPCDGYTLYAPLNSTETYLIANDGQVVHTWTSSAYPGNSVYLLENGHLLRTAKRTNVLKSFVAGGAGGRVEELDWNSKVVWQFTYSNAKYRQHHDIERLPNGNILMIAWEYKSAREAIMAGRDPRLITEGAVWPDHIIEVKPVGQTGGEIVWEWHLWDHLIQEFDPTQANYGVVREHPELVDLNFVENMAPGRGGADWTHINAIDYHPELDQILLSVHGFNEIWVIDHSTTIAEAAGHTGGKSGKGGDLLYRWGNPQAYRVGTSRDQLLYGQHDAKWIESGLLGVGNILVFNNGLNRLGEGKGFSSIEEIRTPVKADGTYSYVTGEPFGPKKPHWRYQDSKPERFYSAYISGAQRLPNGNTLICSGYNGQFFEVTRNGRKVWSYLNPFTQLKADSNQVIRKNAVFRAERYLFDHPGLRVVNNS